LKAFPAFRPLAFGALFALAFLAGWARMGAANRPAEAGTLRKLLEDRPVIGNLEILGTVCREPDMASSHSIIPPGPRPGLQRILPHL
jgi:hypothetical protein